VWFLDLLLEDQCAFLSFSWRCQWCDFLAVWLLELCLKVLMELSLDLSCLDWISSWKNDSIAIVTVTAMFSLLLLHFVITVTWMSLCHHSVAKASFLQLPSLSCHQQNILPQSPKNGHYVMLHVKNGICLYKIWIMVHTQQIKALTADRVWNITTQFCTKSHISTHIDLGHHFLGTVPCELGLFNST